MIKEQVIEGFVEELSSKKPVPGGGGASAMAGALGTALGLMVGNLTVGKKRYAAVEAEVYERMTELTELQKEMFLLADEDAMVFAPLAAAYSLPSGTEKEKAHKAASLVPLQIMEAAEKCISHLEFLEASGSVMAVSDVGVAVQFIRTALTGAVMNVYINTKSMKQRDEAEKINQKAEKLLEEGTKRADLVYEKVLSRLKK